MCNVEAVKALRERGVEVPKKLAVVGFDDSVDAASSLPPLTTVRQPFRKMGRCAAELILERIHNPSSEAKEIVLPVDLVIRNSSTTKPPATAS